GPVAFWRFDELPGNPITDQVAGVLCTKINSPTQGVAGLTFRDNPNRAVTLPGTVADRYVGPTFHSELNVGPTYRSATVPGNVTARFGLSRNVSPATPCVGELIFVQRTPAT